MEILLMVMGGFLAGAAAMSVAWLLALRRHRKMVEKELADEPERPVQLEMDFDTPTYLRRQRANRARHEEMP